jgi:hypothetical protein
MGKKLIIMVIPLIALIAIGIFSGNVYALGHYGIGGSVADCNICHDFASGWYNTPGSGNLRWVKSTIEYPAGTPHSVWFVNFSGPANSGILADATSPYNGPCEVCHTALTTTHYRNDGSGTSHYPGTNCITCHPHFLSDIQNYFEPRFVGNQSHFTHLTDPKGPMFGTSNCTYNLGGCHNTNDYGLFGPGSGQDLANTTICNNCHSPTGVFPGASGLDDPVIGAKANWEDGIYKPVTLGFPYELKAGKENWCATCHDNVPASSNANGTGVKAPNVMGNNSQTYGYNVNGHGNKAVKCGDCHDLAVSHLDGNARTYSASAIPNNYRSGYRLNEDMAVPRNGQIHPAAFRLCTNCHVYTDITGGTSNFRDDAKIRQYHEMHLNWWPALIYADSDFDGVGCSSGTCKDSAITCIVCHNVHGANGNQVMIRHGELISTPGTIDKVPALDFHWYEGDGVTPTTVYEESLYGGLRCGLLPDLSVNHVCGGCHPAYPPTYEIKWYRTPGGPLGVTVDAVWTEGFDGTNWVPQASFDPGEAIHYKVRFTTTGAASSYFMRSPAASLAKNTSGAAWSTPLGKTGTLAPDTHEWTWAKTIPGTATQPSGAKVTVRINMLTASGGTLLDYDVKTVTFSIKP